MISGLWGGQSLYRVDRDLRVIYAEYTLAATNLGHINAQLIRYRTSVLRAIEAHTQKEYRRITDALPGRRTRIEEPLEQFIKASILAASKKSEKPDVVEDLPELRAVRTRVREYMAAAEQTIQLLEQRWQTSSPLEARRLRDRAEANAAEDGGEKFIAVTLELDRLLEVVSRIAGEARNKSDRQLRIMSAIVIAVSTFLSVLVLFTRRENILK